MLDYFDAGDDDLQILADNSAQFCKRLVARSIRDFADNSINASLQHINEETRTNAKKCAPLASQSAVNVDLRIDAKEYAALQCIKHIEKYGINVPDLESKSATQLLNRFKDKYWWLKKLRKRLTRTRERVMISLGRVNKRFGKYCSDITLQQRILQKMRNETLLDNLVMINELNEEIALRDVFEANISNPANRRYELMTRMNGFEKLSRELGHIALFVTVTCPQNFITAMQNQAI